MRSKQVFTVGSMPIVTSGDSPTSLFAVRRGSGEHIREFDKPHSHTLLLNAKY